MTTILVADDRSENREVLSTLLGYKGYQVVEASGGEEALDLIRRRPPELIIADVLMPHMDGFEFVRQLRAEKIADNVPVIFYTASCVESEWRDLARSCGVEHVLVKPCEPEEILRVIRVALSDADGVLSPPPPAPAPDDFGREHLRLLADKLTQKVAELERVNTELHNERANLALALEASAMGTWDWNLDSGETVRSERCRRLLGLPDDDPAADGMWRTVHPDDREQVDAALAESLSTRSSYDIEFRVAWPDGQQRWVAARGRPYYDPDSGKPVRMAGTLLDITDRHAAQAQIELALEEKTVLLNEVHHRVKNNLQVISSLLGLQQRYSRLEPVQLALEESQRRVKAMALIHQLLYERHDYSGVDLGEYLRRLSRMVMQTYSALAQQVRLLLELEPIEMDLQHSVPYGLLVNELLTNCLKHAFPAGRRGTVTVSLRRLDARTALLSVADDGVGIPPHLLAESGTLGLQLIDSLAGQTGGKLRIDHEGGTCFALSFPTAQDG